MSDSGVEVPGGVSPSGRVGLASVMTSKTGLTHAWLFPLAALFGEGLLRFTHHRPLGAATWTVGVLLLYWALEVGLERAVLAPHLRRQSAAKVLFAAGMVGGIIALGRALLGFAELGLSSGQG